MGFYDRDKIVEEGDQNNRVAMDVDQRRDHTDGDQEGNDPIDSTGRVDPSPPCGLPQPRPPTPQQRDHTDGDQKGNDPIDSTGRVDPSPPCGLPQPRPPTPQQQRLRRSRRRTRTSTRDAAEDLSDEAIRMSEKSLETVSARHAEMKYMLEDRLHPAAALLYKDVNALDEILSEFLLKKANMCAGKLPSSIDLLDAFFSQHHGRFLSSYLR